MGNTELDPESAAKRKRLQPSLESLQRWCHMLHSGVKWQTVPGAWSSNRKWLIANSGLLVDWL